jgi:hypothetical protein
MGIKSEFWEIKASVTTPLLASRIIEVIPHFQKCELAAQPVRLLSTEVAQEMAFSHPRLIVGRHRHWIKVAFADATFVICLNRKSFIGSRPRSFCACREPLTRDDITIASSTRAKGVLTLLSMLAGRVLEKARHVSNLEAWFSQRKSDPSDGAHEIAQRFQASRLKTRKSTYTS